MTNGIGKHKSPKRRVKKAAKASAKTSDKGRK
jgi:hypothetical protein